MLIATTATVGLLLVGVLALSMTPGRLGSPEESLATANEAALSQGSEPVGGALGGSPMSVADSLLRAVSTLLSSTSLPASADTQSDLLEPTLVVMTVPGPATTQSTTPPSSAAALPAVPTEASLLSGSAPSGSAPSGSAEETTASTTASDAAPPESTTPEAADPIGDDVDTDTDDTAALGAPEASGLATLTPPPAAPSSSSIPGQSTTSSSSSSTSTTTSSSSTTTLPASTTTIGIPAKQLNNG